MNHSSASSRRPQFGFSLVEVLVGIAIGLIGMLVMFRMVSVWDSHTRTTSSGSDAEIAGTLAMFSLERDIKHAGMGFGTAPATEMGCSVQATDSQRTPSSFSFDMYPVQIASSGAAGTPVQINILHGNSSFFVSNATVKSSTATVNKLEKEQRSGFKPGDLAIIAGPAGTPSSIHCELVEITDDAVPDGASVAHTDGSYSSFYVDPAASAASSTSRFNPATGTVATFSAGNLYSLGPAPQRNAWQIIESNGKHVLARTDLIHNAAPFEVAEGVINLQAQYGVDANNNGQIAASEWTSTAPTDWTKVLAIRVAMLVRSKHYERSTDVTASGTAAVTATAPAPSWGGSFLMTNVDGTADAAASTPGSNNWRYYRYRVYEKVIPLRNVIWGASP